MLAPLTEILEGVLQADRQLMEKTKAKVFSAFITVLQMKERGGEGRAVAAVVSFPPGSQATLAWSQMCLLFLGEGGVEFSVLELWSLGKLFSSPPVSPPLS